ncbi:hypothetical protein [Desulfuromonas thiophila]|uniref:hypothetical protein n=1 Tax=Desulfuromonas thiophila TaxID=57664 RepID=UPI0024A7DA2E|nr:hypothetical protein [Desulfuromonas thiophila]
MNENENNTARNAWLIRLGDEAHNRRFSVTVDHGSSLFRGVEEGDGVLIIGYRLEHNRETLELRCQAIGELGT